MDAFTERILERARERQRLLQGVSNNEGSTRLIGNSKSVSNLTEVPAVPLKEVKSVTNIPYRLSPSKDIASGGQFRRQNSVTRVCSDVQGSAGQQQTKTLNIQRDDFNMEIKVNSAENVRVQVEIEERDEQSEANDENVGLREESKNRLKRLGKLYAGGDEADISSPIHRTEAKFYQSMEEEQQIENRNTNRELRQKKGLSKLADLADNISQWEDDLSHPNIITHKSPTKSWKPPAPQPPAEKNVVSPIKSQKPRAPPPPKAPSPLKSSLVSPEKSRVQQTIRRLAEGSEQPSSSAENTSKHLKWDKKVLDTLESQGFTRSQSSSRLVYAYNSQESNKKAEDVRKIGIIPEEFPKIKKPETPESPMKHFNSGAIANKAAMFEQKVNECPSKPTKDPALLSLAERKALFEKNKGDALVPKAALAMSIPVKVDTTTKASQTKFIGTIKNKENIEQKMKQESPKKTVTVTPPATMTEVNVVPPPLSKVPKHQVEVPAVAVVKRKSGSRLSGEENSPHVVSVLDEVKRIKVSPPKAGRLYPNLSDIEATTTDQDTRTPTPNEENSYNEDMYDSDGPNSSFGRDILQAVCKNATPTKRVTYKETSSGSENSSVMDELDEILEEMDDDSSSGPTPPKQGRHVTPKHTKPQTSNSFHYKSFNTSTSSNSTPKSNFQSPKRSITPRQSLELPLVVDGENVMTLTHTVSFYRKQQNEVHTPVRHIVRQPMIEEVLSDTENVEDEVQQKINRLDDEVNKQQNIISQTSQALNLCSSTPEFSGSTEQVEAERVLLVATHRRQAALHELQRLKVEGTIRPLTKHSKNVPLEKGTLTISNIILPMKQKYVTALAAAGGKGHHVVCLIKCGEQVIPTKLVSTVASNSKNPDLDLYISDSVVFKDIYSDFTVTFEVYCLQAQEECLPHEVKYHINKKANKGLSTPKKNKQESRLIRPPKESPGGPQAVRSSSFALMGYVVFSVQAVNKRVWSLNNTPPMSPLEGSVEMRINCELAVSVEHRGFLTMFEDVSGFGAWHRRWCLLKGDTLSYWKYPEDEKKKLPIDTIDLKNCITKEVGPVSRDICARLHTFLLERERTAHPQDKDTLVVVRKGDKTIIRHLLSADTKEERIEWCHKLNSALTAFRMWGNNSQ